MPTSRHLLCAEGILILSITRGGVSSASTGGLSALHLQRCFCFGWSMSVVSGLLWSSLSLGVFLLLRLSASATNLFLTVLLWACWRIKNDSTDAIPLRPKICSHCLRFAIRMRRFIDAYHKGLNGAQAAWAGRKYRGHRVLPSMLMADLD
ncbi:hypothetical protein BS17DRAFT_738620, partial [Gyrodon lividus]